MNYSDYEVPLHGQNSFKLNDSERTPSLPQTPSNVHYKGAHENFLRKMVGKGIQVEMYEDVTVIGTLRGFDKFTVTLLEDNGKEAVLFKHAMLKIAESSAKLN
jgi:small nuclear ribonucleoprotein (snRNP)-like protein